MRERDLITVGLGRDILISLGQMIQDNTYLHGKTERKREKEGKKICYLWCFSISVLKSSVILVFVTLAVNQKDNPLLWLYSRELRYTNTRRLWEIPNMSLRNSSPTSWSMLIC